MTEEELESVRQEILNKPKPFSEILNEESRYIGDEEFRYLTLRYPNGKVEEGHLAYFGEHRDTCNFKGEPLLLLYSCLCSHRVKNKKKTLGRFDPEYKAESLTKKIGNE